MATKEWNCEKKLLIFQCMWLLLKMHKCNVGYQDEHQILMNRYHVEEILAVSVTQFNSLLCYVGTGLFVVVF